jgi:GT2 family glycosyltransferase
VTTTIQGIPSEIVVADNGSTDDSARVAERLGARTLHMPDRPVAEVRNAAAQAASGELLAFVDADHVLAPGWALAAVHAMRPDVAAAGAQYHAPAGGSWVQRMYDRFRRHRAEPGPTDWLPSGNLIVRRAAFERLGGFDVALETCEDVDFCQRLRQSGATLIEDPGLHSTHFGDPPTLKALFLAELWRGRDNWRVTLRGPLTVRTAPSLLVPLATLGALAVVAVGLCLVLSFVTSSLGWALVSAGGLVLVGSALLRAGRLLAETPAAERGVLAALQAVAVGGTYELARALALVLRTGHNVRRKGEARPHA